ncbi:MAG: HDIG domain-containing protein [Clostridiales bacterium]|nr:HDIG domain-containing protein [Clostridiales bacterium]
MLQDVSIIPVGKTGVNVPTSVYSHSVQVACLSLYLSRKLKRRVNERALIRGALLHDDFLYDWHDRGHEHSLHGFTHSGTALPVWEKRLCFLLWLPQYSVRVNWFFKKFSHHQ